MRRSWALLNGSWVALCLPCPRRQARRNLERQTSSAPFFRSLKSACTCTNVVGRHEPLVLKQPMGDINARWAGEMRYWSPLPPAPATEEIGTRMLHPLFNARKKRIRKRTGRPPPGPAHSKTTHGRHQYAQGGENALLVSPAPSAALGGNPHQNASHPLKCASNAHTQAHRPRPANRCWL